jgi:hypothetical protein
MDWAMTRVKLGVATLVVLAVSFAVAAGANAALELDHDCGNVGPNADWCITSTRGIGYGYARFTTVNGAGVDHCARIWTPTGYHSAYGCTSAQFARSACVVSSSEMGAQGWNQANSTHHFTIQLYSGCY